MHIALERRKALALPAPARAKQNLKPYLLCAPMVLFALAFVYYPFFKTLMDSFSVVNFRGQITAFAGLSNYASLLGKSNFHLALQNTLRLTCLNVPVTLIVTLGLALLCRPRRRLGPLYETLFTLPMAVAMSAASMIFKVLLNPTVGYVNYALGLNLGWFTNRATALYGILLITVWMGIPFNFLLFLAAFRAVPQALTEAAQMDGAGYWARLFKVQLPMVSPTILYVLCTNTVLSLMTAGPVMIITQGGPSRSTSTLLYLMYTSGYGSANYSMAACVAVLTFLITLAFTVMAFLLERRGVHYQ